MKVIYLLLLLIIVFSACDDDFDVNTDWEEITVVYGLLDYSRDEQYIRIQKAFLPDDEDARNVASIKDSNYFDEGEIEVKLQAWQSGQMIEEVTLSPAVVDGKEPGIFHSPDHVLYKTPDDFAIRPDARYRLEIKTDRGNTITGETQLVGEMRWIAPNPHRNTIPFTDSTLRIRIISGRNAYFYDVKLHFYYEEFEIGNEDNSELKSVTWTAFTGRRPEGGQLRLTTSYEALFNVIRPQIPDDPSVQRRTSHLKIEVFGGGEALYNYIRVHQPAIGVVQKKPDYSNLSEGFGVFSSRHTQSRELEFDEDFRKYLIARNWLRNLNFE